MLILRVALSPLSSLRAILRPLYIWMVPGPTHDTAGPLIRIYDRMLYLCADGVKNVSISTWSWCPVTFHLICRSIACLAPQQLAADMTVTFHMLINCDDDSVWLIGQWQAAMSTHERAGRRDQGLVCTSPEGTEQRMSEANKEDTGTPP